MPLCQFFLCFSGTSISTRKIRYLSHLGSRRIAKNRHRSYQLSRRDPGKPFTVIWGGSGTLLGSLWDRLGSTLGASWRQLGRLLAPNGAKGHEEVRFGPHRFAFVKCGVCSTLGGTGPARSALGGHLRAPLATPAVTFRGQMAALSRRRHCFYAFSWKSILPRKIQGWRDIGGQRWHHLGASLTPLGTHFSSIVTLWDLFFESLKPFSEPGGITLAIHGCKKCDLGFGVAFSLSSGVILNGFR